MTDPKINVSNTCFGAGFGLFLLIAVWLVVGRGWENEPSVFEQWLNARYQYRAPDANWQAPNRVAPADENDRPATPAAELDDDAVIQQHLPTDDARPEDDRSEDDRSEDDQSEDDQSQGRGSQAGGSQAGGSQAGESQEGESSRDDVASVPEAPAQPE